MARGRTIFADRIVGLAPNRQLLAEVPARLTPPKLRGPVLAPIDEALPPRVQVRCADCHNVAVSGPPVLLTESPPPFGRCSHCHHGHARLPELANREPSTERGPLPWVPLEELAPIASGGELAFCGRCHDRHDRFGPAGSSSGLLLPYDGAPGAQQQVPWVPTLHSPSTVGAATIGGFIAVPPLQGIRASAPYLHDGSVSSLGSLLDDPPAASSARVFAHRFGIGLGPAEKRDLVAFLQSL